MRKGKKREQTKNKALRLKKKERSINVKGIQSRQMGDWEK